MLDGRKSLALIKLLLNAQSLHGYVLCRKLSQSVTIKGRLLKYAEIA